MSVFQTYLADFQKSADQQLLKNVVGQIVQ